jgi:CubicO group peptidase (beta-lactamase class C family)
VDALQTAVRAFVAGVHDAGLELHGLMLSRHDRLVAQGWWAPYGPEQPHLLYSLSKTFTATAYAFAEAEGLIGRDVPLIGLWPEFADAAGPRASTWTPRHLLRMASGHTADVFFGGTPGDEAVLGRGDLDAVGWCFAQEPDAEPGSLFVYNQLCTYLIAAAVQKVTGERLTDYLRPRLFEPLGIDVARWQADNAGRQIGFTGLHVRLEAALALGRCYLRRGLVDGRRLLPEAWFDDATRALSDTSGPEPDGTPRNPDWSYGYGYQLWMASHGYRGDGAFGQFMLVLPAHDAVLAINSGEQDMQAILDRVWTHLLPGLAGPTASDEVLQLDDLMLPAWGGDGPDGVFRATELTYVHIDGWTLPVPVARLQASRVGDGWRLDLDAAGAALAVRAGDGTWVDDEVDGSEGPVALASSAGWDSGRFRARIILTSSPHSVLLEGDPSTGTLRARWSVPPLRGTSIQDLGLPG